MLAFHFGTSLRRFIMALRFGTYGARDDGSIGGCLYTARQLHSSDAPECTPTTKIALTSVKLATDTQPCTLIGDDYHQRFV